MAHKSETILSGFYFSELQSRPKKKKKKTAELVPSFYLCLSTVEIFLCPKFKLMLLELDLGKVEKSLLENKHLTTLKAKLLLLCNRSMAFLRDACHIWNISP